MSNLNAAQVSRLRLARPDVAVQAELIREARELQSDHAARLATIKREIELLREFNTRLIADVVTGQVDIREIAASLDEPARLRTDGVPDADELEVDDVLETSEI